VHEVGKIYGFRFRISDLVKLDSDVNLKVIIGQNFAKSYLLGTDWINYTVEDWYESSAVLVNITVEVSDYLAGGGGIVKFQDFQIFPLFVCDDSDDLREDVTCTENDKGWCEDEENGSR